MGDIIEITTSQAQAPTYYKVSAGAISFELKGLAGAVGLAESSGKTCQYIIIFHRENRIVIKGPQGVRNSEQISTLSLSNTQFKRFWITWNSGILRIGQDREPSHVYSYPNVTTNLNYVVFFIMRSLPHLATWRFELPPASVVKLPKTPCKAVTGGELRWVQADSQLPDNAVVGGFEGECLYIIRGAYRGSLTPGKFVPSEGVAFVPWGGDANEVPEFEILVGYNFTWEPASENRIPVNAFVAGHSEVSEEKLYIGRVTHMNCLIPGKVQPTHKSCYIAFEDKEVGYKQYEILVVPDSNPYADNNFCNNCKVFRNLHYNMGHDDAQEEYDNDEQSDGEEEDSDQYMMEDD